MKIQILTAVFISIFIMSAPAQEQGQKPNTLASVDQTKNSRDALELKQKAAREIANPPLPKVPEFDPTADDNAIKAEFQKAGFKLEDPKDMAVVDMMIRYQRLFQQLEKTITALNSANSAAAAKEKAAADATKLVGQMVGRMDDISKRVDERMKTLPVVSPTQSPQTGK